MKKSLCINNFFVDIEFQNGKLVFNMNGKRYAKEVVMAPMKAAKKVAKKKTGVKKTAKKTKKTKKTKK